MDPTIVLKLVRDQRRQINDTFSPQQKLSSNHSFAIPNSSTTSEAPRESFQFLKSDQSVSGNNSDDRKKSSSDFFRSVKNHSNFILNDQKIYSSPKPEIHHQNFHFSKSLNEPNNESNFYKFENRKSSNSSYYSNDFKINNQISSHKMNSLLSLGKAKSPYELVKKSKISKEEPYNFQEKFLPRNYFNYTKFPDNLKNLNLQSNKISLQNNFLFNEQIYLKDCRSANKQMIEHKEDNFNLNSKYSFCDCKECNGLDNINLNQEQGILPSNSQHVLLQSYCDCPSCNFTVSNIQNDELIPIISKKSFIYPIPPVPTNGFVISKNSSFSPIIPSNKKDLNKYVFKNISSIQQGIMPHSENKCYCADCIHDKNEIHKQDNKDEFLSSPCTVNNLRSNVEMEVNKDYHINQKGLTLPIILENNLNNCEEFQNIVKLQNKIFIEQINKRKLDQTFEKKTTVIQNMSKKNRILNKEKTKNDSKNSDDIVCCLRSEEIELGEILNLEKEKFDQNTEISLTTSKKMMLIISKRINDWLEKTVEFIYNFSTKRELEHEKLLSILCCSWFRILLVYMIENKFEFYLTKDGEEEKNDYLSAFLREKDASELLIIIHKYHDELQLEKRDYDLLREILLLKDNSNEPNFSEYLQEVNMKIEENSKEKYKFDSEKLTFFLSNIQNIKKSLIKNLFNQDVLIEDLLSKKILDFKKEK